MSLMIRCALAVCLLAGGASACSERVDDAPPVAAPSLTLSDDSPAIGSPVDMSYRFVVPSGAPSITEDAWVFVHFIDTDGELMWTDDHEPPTPTTQWKPGSTIQYTRTMFVPKFPYVGETHVEVGLYSPQSGNRLPLQGQTGGQRAYRVAQFDMRLESDNLFVVFKDGWHATEFGTEGPGREWQWSRKDGILSFRNPKRDVRFYLQLDQPVPNALSEPQQVEIRVGDAVLERFALPGGGSELRRIDISAGQLGEAETVDMTVATDKTFVPASVPALKSSDPRELGVRVFRAFVEER